MIVRGPASNLPFPPFHQRFPWLGGDLQTLRNTLRGVPPLSCPTERMHFPTRDGSGDVLQGALDRPDQPQNKPLIVLIHGLTGSEDSSHIIAASREHLSRGHKVLRLNQRGAGPSRATCQGHYHAGRTDDLANVIRQLPQDLTKHGVCLMAVSLGANMMLKFLAEYPDFPRIKAAVAVCPPVDLKAAQERIMMARNAPYHRYLLNRMKTGIQNTDLIIEKGHRFLDTLATVFDFDDQIVAPGNGYANALDYYQRCSSLNLLGAIRTPTLVIHPIDDPWVSAGPLLSRTHDGSATPHLSILAPPHGGHVGSHARGSNAPWYVTCADLFFNHA